MRDRGSSNHTPRTKAKKHSYNDGHGRNLTAGGILFYDDNGLYLISEDKRAQGRNVLEFTDFGGRYSRDDGDIYQTIVRELAEESYLSICITRQTLLMMLYVDDKFTEFNPNASSAYVHGHNREPVYVCYLVHASHAAEFGVSLNSDVFQDGREYTLAHNPDAGDYYKISGLHHISYEKLPEVRLSHRLKRIIRYSSILKNLVPPMISLS